MSRAAAAALLSSLAFAGGVAAGPPEGAEGPPVGGCPTGAWWEQGTPQPGHGGLAVDFNGDGDVCKLEVPGGGFLFVDNVVR